MVHSWKLAALAAVLLACGSGSAAAQVNALTQGGVLTFGHIVGVQAGDGQAMLVIRTTPRKTNWRAANPAANPAAANLGAPNLGAAGVGGAPAAGPNQRRFLLAPTTRVQAVRNGRRMPATLAALRPGQRVAVQSSGPQAVIVSIILHNGRTAVVAPTRYSVPRSTMPRNTARTANFRRAQRAPLALTPTAR